MIGLARGITTVPDYTVTVDPARLRSDLGGARFTRGYYAAAVLRQRGTFTPE